MLATDLKGGDKTQELANKGEYLWGISGLQGIYNLLDGAKVTITSKTDASDSAEWTVQAVPCNNPAIYTDEESGESYMLFGNGGNGYNIVKLNEDMVSFDASAMYHYPDGTFPNFRESIHVFKKDNRYHFTWSCNDTGQDSYCINYAVADSLYPEKNADGYIEKITPTLTGIQEPVYVNPPKEPDYSFSYMVQSLGDNSKHM